MLDLDYKGTMTDILKMIRRQPFLPSKQAETKIVMEANTKKRTTDTNRIPASSSSNFSIILIFRCSIRPRRQCGRT